MRALLASAITLLLIAPLFAVAPPIQADPAEVGLLLRDLDSDHFPVRHQADAALRRLGKSVLPLLRRELARSRSLEVKHRLGRIIQELTLDERIEGLIQSLNDRDAEIRDRARYTLRLAGRSVVPLLQRELKPTLDEASRQRLADLIAELAGLP